jgi:hypothetical protein
LRYGRVVVFFGGFFHKVFGGAGKKDLDGMGWRVYLCRPLLKSDTVLKILIIKPERIC